jgi:CRISPR-associated protein Cmr4
MFEAQKMLYLYVETSLHAGSGTGLGVVDLPIQRERATGYPMIQASGIKGKLRSEAEAIKGSNDPDLLAVFGPDSKGSEHAGALAAGDGRILLFPVRSLAGVFAWVTSEAVLARFIRDYGQPLPWKALGPAGEGEAIVSGNDVVANNQIVLEEFAFKAVAKPEVKAIADWLAQNALPLGAEYDYWRKTLPNRLVILPEDAFRDFVQFSTEVISRIKLNDEKKTVERGALWTEEHLPAETLLYVPMYASRSRKEGVSLTGQEVVDFVANLKLPRVQLGGDETVGRGLVSLRWG